MMKSNSDINTTTTASAAVACGNCGIEERRFLHHVRHRGSFRRLCTSCVLRLHPHSFCPTCFHVYDHSPPPSINAVTCFKCYSSSHSHCVGSGVTSPYVCPPCTNPNAPIFVPRKAGDGKSYREVDKKSAGILFAAARIAAVSMSKAVVSARAEAERRAKEAAFTRKRAREALEHVASLVTKDKMRRESNSNSNSNSNSGNVIMKYRSNIGGVAMELNRIRTNPIGNNQRVVDGSSEVLAALNAVELKEKEKERLQVYTKPQNMISAAPPPVQCVVMDVENHNKLGVNSIQNVEGPNANSAHFDKQNLQVGEKVTGGLHCVPPDHVNEKKNFQQV